MTKLFAGLDFSQDKTAICVVNEQGDPIFEGEANSSAPAIAAVLRPYRRALEKVGHETGMYTPWLHKELLKRRLPAVCLDARLTRAALAAQRNKTDRNDARDIAIAISRGFNGTAYVKSTEAHQIRMLLTCRRALKRRSRDLETVLRTTLKAFGSHLERMGDELKIRQPVRHRNSFVTSIADAVMRARSELLKEVETLDSQVRALAAADPVCKRLMTAPGVGPITALTFRAAIDDPHRFASSRDVGAHFGLTPRRIQSGKSDYSGRISRYGDANVRAVLYDAAATMLNSTKKPSAYRAWGLALRARKGFKAAAVACARKLAVILHRMWIMETDFTASP